MGFECFGEYVMNFFCCWYVYYDFYYYFVGYGCYGYVFGCYVDVDGFVGYLLVCFGVKLDLDDEQWCYFVVWFGEFQCQCELLKGLVCGLQLVDFVVGEQFLCELIQQLFDVKFDVLCVVGFGLIVVFVEFFDLLDMEQ